MNIRLGTRGSKLALTQAAQIQCCLAQAYPQHTFELVVIQTTGDKNRLTPLHQMRTSGVFVKELEQQLYEQQIDIAVHSMKDLPAVLADGLVLGDVLLREDARDVLISKQHRTLRELTANARIATGSLRRKYQLLQQRPDLRIEAIRGNIDTRLSLLEEGDLDGIIVAAAAMHRLGRQAEITMYFDEQDMVPAACQGAIGLELRQQDQELWEMIHALRDAHLSEEIAIERAFLRVMNGGCHTPMGARCHITDHIELTCVYGSEDGSAILTHRFEAERSMGETLVAQAASFMKTGVK